jgi:hypothetical protein
MPDKRIEFAPSGARLASSEAVCSRLILGVSRASRSSRAQLQRTVTRHRRRAISCARGALETDPSVRTARTFLTLERVLGPAVGALRPAALLDRQIHSRMRIPQVHLRHRARQGQVLARHVVLVLGVGLDERFTDRRREVLSTLPLRPPQRSSRNLLAKLSVRPSPSKSVMPFERRSSMVFR